MSAYLARFAHVICTANETDIRSNVTLGGKLIIEHAGNLKVSYAPFEHIERGARIVIVGITPGYMQATSALCEVRRQLLAGADQTSALAAAKVYASFSGGMRANLVQMLDYIGVARWLAQPSRLRSPRYENFPHARSVLHQIKLLPPMIRPPNAIQP